jgi:hypothetical protein
MEKDMSIARIIAATAVVAGASTAMAQDVPDPNPIFNPDGTMTWYIGFNTQYPFLQDAIDAAQPGDELVITEGLYVESVVVNTPDLTIRPKVDVEGAWVPVTMWNPTEGFENDNDYAIKVLENTNNTYIGRSRQITQLASGSSVDTAIIPGEYNWDGIPGTEITVANIDTSLDTDKVINFWSRGMDDVAVWSDGGQATFMKCSMRGHDGFGGAVLCTGDTNTTSFVRCEMRETNAPGLDMAGYPINVITISGGEGMNVSFNGCNVSSNIAGSMGVIYQNGGSCSWNGCYISGNKSFMGFGTYTVIGGTPYFSHCRFEDNESRYGTVYSDSTGLTRDDMINFTKCEWKRNETTDILYGGAFYAVDSASGGSPLCHFDACKIENNNGHSDMSSYDIDTPYFPEMRIGRDFGDVPPSEGPSTLPGDLNADGVVNGADMGILLSNWGLGG